MNNFINEENILPPAFMATTRQKILLKTNQVQDYALEYPQSPVISAFLAIGNAAISLFPFLDK